MHLAFSNYDYHARRTPRKVRRAARWLGLSHSVGRLVSYWILTEKRTVTAYHGAMRHELEKQIEEFEYAIDEPVPNVISRKLTSLDSRHQSRVPKIGPITCSLIRTARRSLIRTTRRSLIRIARRIYNPSVPEADKDFARDVYDDM
jgi:hypothetical protein